MNIEPTPNEHAEREVASSLATRIAKMIGLAFAGVIVIVLLGFILAWVVQFLWNATLSAMFEWPRISYWQALGIFILAKVFFGFGGGMRHAAPEKSKKDRERDERARAWWQRHLGKPEENAQSAGADEEFKKYWESEGRAAFDAYLAAKSANDTK